jgi:hypothetical protein
LLVHKTMLYNEVLSKASVESLSIPPAFHDTLILAISLQGIVFVLCFVRGK